MSVGCWFGEGAGLGFGDHEIAFIGGDGVVVFGFRCSQRWRMVIRRNTPQISGEDARHASSGTWLGCIGLRFLLCWARLRSGADRPVDEIDVRRIRE